MRNRLSTLDSRNKRHVGDALEMLAGRIGYRLLDGFGERVVFRQLFLQGLTVLDLRDEGTEVQLNMSHLAARQEIRHLLEAIVNRAPTAPADEPSPSPDADGEEEAERPASAATKGEPLKPAEAPPPAPLDRG
jgi:hypothetical protein